MKTLLTTNQTKSHSSICAMTGSFQLRWRKGHVHYSSHRTSLEQEWPRPFLLVTLMSLNVGHGSFIDDYQREPDDTGLNPPALDSISLTRGEAQNRRDLLEQNHEEALRCTPAGLPPATLLARHLADVSANTSSIAVVKDSNLAKTVLDSVGFLETTCQMRHRSRTWIQKYVLFFQAMWSLYCIFS